MVFVIIITPTTYAHEARPVLVDINQTGSDKFSVAIKIPKSLPENGLPQLAMPNHCRELSSPIMRRGSNGYLLQANYHCPQGLAEQLLVIVYPSDQVSTNTLFRLSLLSGEQLSHLLSPTQRRWKIPVTASSWSQAQDYTRLGIKHIWGGVDHLLFVACLVFIAGSAKRIIITISGFSVAHSLTLIVSGLGILSVAVPPVELVIALSIVLLAHEIVVNNQYSWTWRYPVAVSSSFGLLHGFGFAAVLKDIDLDKAELIPALLFFNVGVEVGQLLFIAVILMVAKGWPSSWSKPLSRQILIYLIGGIAAYWFISRLLVL